MGNLTGLDSSRHIPNQPAVTGGGIHAQAANPVVAGRKAGNERVAIEVGLGFSSKIFHLGGVGGELRNFSFVFDMQVIPSSPRIDGIEFEFDTLNGEGIRVNEFSSRGEVFLFLFLVLVWICFLVGIAIFRHGKTLGDAAGVGTLIGVEEFRNLHDVVGGEEFVDVGRSKFKEVVGLQPGFQFRRNFQVVNEFIASGKNILVFDFLDDVGIALGKDEERELADGFGLGAGWSDTNSKINRAGALGSE